MADPLRACECHALGHFYGMAPRADCTLLVSGSYGWMTALAKLGAGDADLFGKAPPVSIAVTSSRNGLGVPVHKNCYTALARQFQAHGSKYFNSNKKRKGTCPG